ncbi:MAG TPA: PAS domain S-box protein [Coleofasciculaceae cyanobacterium]
MPEFLQAFFTSSGLIPDETAYLWKPQLIGLDALSHWLIALANYFLLSVLVYWVWQRRDISSSWMFWLCGTFLATCGTAHLSEVWNPTSWLVEGVKVITTLGIWGTALLFVILIPKLIALPVAVPIEAIRRLLRRKITQRQVAENALQSCEQQFRTLVENAQDIIARYDRQLRHLYINSAIQRVTGIPADQFLGKTLSGVGVGLSQELIWGWEAGIKSVFATGEMHWMEFDYPCTHGQEFYQARLVPEIAPDGSVESVLCVIRDITQLKQTKDALKRANEQLEIRVQERTAELIKMNESLQMEIAKRQRQERQLRLLESVVIHANDAVLITEAEPIDEPGPRILYANAAFTRMTGYTLEEVLGKTPRILQGQNSDRTQLDRIRAALSTWKPITVEVINYHKNGSEFWVELSLVPIANEQGWYTHWIAVQRDITKRKQAEQEIRDLNESLEHRIAERTVELEAINKELEAFCYSVSHDLRSPLRGLDGFSQALLERYTEQLDEQGKHYLQRIRANTQKMGQLIDDLLMLSRVTRREMQRTTVDLSGLATEIAAELQQTQPERQVKWAIAPGLIAKGDARLLRVVLENLLNNAWKFTSYCLQPRIEFNAILKADAKLVYFVHDNGAGFDMTYANKLFGAFQRLHSTTQFPGTGIGLATVQRIIHKHGGQVWAESAVDQGATFYFTL